LARAKVAIGQNARFAACSVPLRKIYGIAQMATAVERAIVHAEPLVTSGNMPSHAGQQSQSFLRPLRYGVKSSRNGANKQSGRTPCAHCLIMLAVPGTVQTGPIGAIC
jgi:hypothetical protein